MPGITRTLPVPTENSARALCVPISGGITGRLSEGLLNNQGRPIEGRDYTLGPAYRKGVWRRSDTVRIMVTGVGGTPMIPYRSMLNDPDDLAEFWDVTAYVDDMIRRARDTGTD